MSERGWEILRALLVLPSIPVAWLSPAVEMATALSIRLRYRGTRIGIRARVGSGCVFGDHVRIGARSLLANVSVGRFSYFAEKVVVRNATIGSFCSIGPMVRIGLGRHPTQGWVSSHPAFYSAHPPTPALASKPAFEEVRLITVGDDVWIGAGAIIVDGVRIETGAIIGAGAVVTRDVPAYSVVGGIPARKIRDRFPPEIRAELLKSEWWLRDEAWLRKYGQYFDDARLFLQEMERIGHDRAE